MDFVLEYPSLQEFFNKDRLAIALPQQGDPYAYVTFQAWRPAVWVGTEGQILGYYSYHMMRPYSLQIIQVDLERKRLVLKEVS